MAGHSKWATIKRKKAALDKKKGAKFTTLSKAITQAAKQNPNPNSPALRDAIAQAKKASMPKANIQKAQQPARNTNLHTITYEAQAPHGIALIIKIQTDNKNRTVATIRNHLNKQNATLKKGGTNQHYFQQGSTLTIATQHAHDQELHVTLAEAGASTIEHYKEHLQIHCQRENLPTIAAILKDRHIPIRTTTQGAHPHSPIFLPPHQKVQVQHLLDTLSKIDEVTQIHHNLQENTFIEKIL